MAALATAIEKSGIPTVVITALPSIAAMMGATRVVRGRAIVHPVGDSSLGRDEELALRYRIIETALRMLETDVAGATVWSIPEH